MKGIFLACLLVSLQSTSPARAYEADIHYSTTYVLARAVGWPEAEALTIASANQAVDENQDTVAALKVEAAPGPAYTGYVMRSFRQAEKNLQFHCFSRTRERGERISADVRKVISRHFAGVPDHEEEPRRNTRRLIALGVALHCEQDAHSHVGFGGSCGSHSGNCHGHAYQTLLDQVVFSLVKKHYFNPDHPGVAGARLLETLQGTVREMAARRPRSSTRSIQTRELVSLSDALRGSGLDLPDDMRRNCNRYIAGKWLHDFFQHRGQASRGSHTLERLTPAAAVTCRNASLAWATVVRIPEPRFPRLNPDASPYLVRADGTYQLVRAGDYAVSSPRVHAHDPADPLTNYKTHKVNLQLSHWSHILALPHLERIAHFPQTAAVGPRESRR